MIGFLRGILAEKGEGYILIDVNGVGYVVNVPANTKAFLSSEGQEVTVYTMMSVRDDDVSLFGFSGRAELDTFKKLISVNGVGPKAGISIMSAFTLEQLQQAIVFEDSKTLTKANGIGKKTAERIVLELKDKFNAPVAGEDSVSVVADSNGSPAQMGGKAEAVDALMALGYSRAEAMNALTGIKDKDLSTEEYIKRALKKLF